MTGIRRMIRNLRQKRIEQHNATRLGSDAMRDIGVTAGDVSAAIDMKIDLPDRMGRMAAVFGAAPALRRADRWQVFDMARVCDACKHRHACNHALAAEGGAAPGDVAFCPNAGEYRVLAAQEAG